MVEVLMVLVVVIVLMVRMVEDSTAMTATELLKV